jgi:hypothetical protein
MKYFILFSLLFSSLYASECYTNKYLDKTFCFDKYYDRKNIYSPKNDEKYYKTKNGTIYAISNKIKVKFNSSGAILTVLDDYEVDFNTNDNDNIGDFRIGFNQYDLEFLDKIRGDTYIFRVKKPDALFIIVRKLNELSSVKSAEPILKRKFTKTEIQQRKATSKQNQKTSAGKSGSGQRKTISQQGFKGGNFLKGGVQ